MKTYFSSVGAVVRVYFPRLLLETIEEFPAYDVMRLSAEESFLNIHRICLVLQLFGFVANVGGLMGIWAGMSLISLFEFILVIIESCMKLLKI